MPHFNLLGESCQAILKQFTTLFNSIKNKGGRGKHEPTASQVDRAFKRSNWQNGLSQTDLAIVVGVSPSAITQLFKDGKVVMTWSFVLKKLRINESWEKFEG